VQQQFGEVALAGGPLAVRQWPMRAQDLHRARSGVGGALGTTNQPLARRGAPESVMDGRAAEGEIAVPIGDGKSATTRFCEPASESTWTAAWHRLGRER
jgi:hypothetical protein